MTPERYRPVFERVVATGEPTVLDGGPLTARQEPGAEPTFWRWTLLPACGEGREVGFLLLLAQDVSDSLRSGQERLEAGAAVVEQARGRSDEGGSRGRRARV